MLCVGGQFLTGFVRLPFFENHMKTLEIPWPFIVDPFFVLRVKECKEKGIQTYVVHRKARDETSDIFDCGMKNVFIEEFC